MAWGSWPLSPTNFTRRSSPSSISSTGWKAPPCGREPTCLAPGRRTNKLGQANQRHQRKRQRQQQREKRQQERQQADHQAQRTASKCSNLCSGGLPPPHVAIGAMAKDSKALGRVLQRNLKPLHVQQILTRGFSTVARRLHLRLAAALGDARRAPRSRSGEEEEESSDDEAQQREEDQDSEDSGWRASERPSASAAAAVTHHLVSRLREGPSAAVVGGRYLIDCLLLHRRLCSALPPSGLPPLRRLALRLLNAFMRHASVQLPEVLDVVERVKSQLKCSL
eukprot:GHVT01063903.1.p1 GENE.GHVT01063903.1~~GHVT01063903.1.p1  ORF type:complete len:280 (-),score=84.31 GHVT01063903.1:148-987(-)